MLKSATIAHEMCQQYNTEHGSMARFAHIESSQNYTCTTYEITNHLHSRRANTMKSGTLPMAQLLLVKAGRVALIDVLVCKNLAATL